MTKAMMVTRTKMMVTKKKVVTKAMIVTKSKMMVPKMKVVTKAMMVTRTKFFWASKVGLQQLKTLS